MFDLDSWQEIWVTISRNKLRSILTGFGVFWGIFMLAVLFGLGNSLEGGMRKNFDGFATNAVFFFTDRTSEAYKGFRKGRQWSMHNRDVALIRERATSVEHISPMLWGGSFDKNIVNGQKAGTYATRGVYPEFYLLEGQNILEGRLFNQIDIEEKRKVCVIGIEVYETLYEKGEKATGKYLRVNGVYFQVIGVISPKSKASIGGDPKENVFIPFSTMQQTFNQGDVIHFLGCTIKPGYDSAQVEEEVKNILRSANTISPTDEKALRGFNLEKEFQMFDMLFVGVAVIVWLVGGGALLSGMIGISNIMLVTVRERTREIGVRRALGAKPHAILIQILSESFVLTAIAGLLGLFSGIAAVELVNYLMAETFVDHPVFIPPFVPFDAAIRALVVLIFSGIFAGIMPAMRALKVKAIDAIRDE